jgi:hypothetical protein
MATDSIRKQLVNIRKTLERSKKKRRADEGSDSDDEQEHFNTQVERYSVRESDSMKY